MLKPGDIAVHTKNGKKYEIVRGPWLNTRTGKDRYMANVKCLDQGAKQHTRVMDTVNLKEAR